MARVGVVVPVYKVEKYLEKCVASIQNQTFDDLEIILVDDGSPDRCPEICDQLAKNDARIKVIHKKNGGLSSARNAGIDEAVRNKTEYIMFVDSDDRVDPTIVQVLLDACIHANAPLSSCGLRWLTENSDRPFEISRTDGRNILSSSHELINKMWTEGFDCSIFTPAYSKLYKTDFFKDILHYKEGIICEDDQLATYLFLKDYPVVIVNQSLYSWRMNASSITHTVFKERNCVYLEILRERYYVFRENGFHEPSLRVAQLFAESYIEYYMKAKNAGHTEWVTAYREVYKEMRKKCRKNTSLKTKIRHAIFSMSPSVYAKLVLRQ